MESMIGKDVATIHTLTPQGGIPSQDFSAFVALACWRLWKARNAFVFRNETQTLSQVFGACKNAAALWRARLPKKKKDIAVQWCQILDMAGQA
jgi:hypothetical protein